MRRELRIALGVMGALVLIGVGISIALQPELLRPPGRGGADWRNIAFVVALVAVGVVAIVQGVVALAEWVRKPPEAPIGQPAIEVSQHVETVAGGVTMIGVQNVTQPPPAPPFSPLHTLRAPVGDFTGRADEVRDLVAYLSQDGATAANSRTAHDNTPHNNRLPIVSLLSIRATQRWPGPWRAHASSVPPPDPAFPSPSHCFRNATAPSSRRTTADGACWAETEAAIRSQVAPIGMWLPTTTQWQVQA